MCVRVVIVISALQRQTQKQLTQLSQLSVDTLLPPPHGIPTIIMAASNAHQLNDQHQTPPLESLQQAHQPLALVVFSGGTAFNSVAGACTPLASVPK